MISTSVNLSTALVRMGHKVLLIDADPQGDASSMLGIDTEEISVALATLLERLIKDEDIEPGDGKIPDVEGVDIIPSNIDLAALEASLVNVMNRERLLKDFVSINIVARNVLSFYKKQMQNILPVTRYESFWTI